MSRPITVSAEQVRIINRGRIVRRDTYILSRTLLESLHTIKDLADEEHTKQNIQALIDGIHQLSPTK